MKDKLREMYENGLRGIEPSISANGLLKAVANGWITTEDAVEILGSDNALETVRAAKLLEISKACNAVIVAGVDVPIGDRRDHFNLKLEDQSNINNLFRVVELGGTEFPYQADDGTCTVYSATEIAQIYVAAQTLITGQTAYHNALKSYVNAMTDAEEIAAVQYGKEHLTSRFQFAIYQERRYHHHQAGEQRHIPLQEKPDGKQDCQYRSNTQNNLLQHIVGDAFALQFEVLIFCFFDGIV